MIVFILKSSDSGDKDYELRLNIHTVVWRLSSISPMSQLLFSLAPSSVTVTRMSPTTLFLLPPISQHPCLLLSWPVSSNRLGFYSSVNGFCVRASSILIHLQPAPTLPWTLPPHSHILRNIHNCATWTTHSRIDELCASSNKHFLCRLGTSTVDIWSVSPIITQHVLR